jgi:hypothetical protein
LPRCSLARGFFFSKALQLLEYHLFLGHFRRTVRTAHLLLTLVGFRADLAFAEPMAAFVVSPREGFCVVKKPSSSDCQTLLPHSGTSFFRQCRPKS